MDSYQQKLSKLSPRARDWYNSGASIEANLLVCQRNNIAGDEIGLNTDLVNNLFFKDLALKDLVIKIKDIFKFDDIKAKKLAADIVGIRLLVVDDDWFNGEAAAYLKSLGVPPENYQKIIDDQRVAVRKEKEEEAIDEANRQAEKEAALEETTIPVAEGAVPLGDFKIDWQVEKEEALKTFKNGLADIISSNEVQEEFNDVLIYLLADQGESFRAELERTLLANNEVLTFTKFVIDGRPAPAVISAWLKNFISEVGSGNFDNLALTKFLTNSANAKILSDEERNIVKQLLLVYRNIKFYPESMPNTTGEGWQIIPSQTAGEEKFVQVKEKIESRMKEVATADKLAAKLPTKADKDKEQEAAKNLDELNKVAASYPANSLQRKAVEAEMRKINKNNQSK
jgi:hypothetical protein